MRPPGEVSLALLRAAAAGPAPVRVLAQRVQVGFDVARYTASRLVERGELARLSDVRPVVLGLPEHLGTVSASDSVRSFWEQGGEGEPADSGGFACL